MKFVARAHPCHIFGVNMLYNNYSSYIRETYSNKKVIKVCIDGGFTCPNRDGTKGVGGCIFCGERGSGEHIAKRIPKEQVEHFMKKCPKADLFLAYFQNFTNTYAPISVLKERYDSALSDSRVVGLIIGTRPDCINEEVADLLAKYNSTHNLWVELGLQSASDDTGKVINRGYPTADFIKAVGLLEARGIKTVAHMIVGLPGEDKGEVDATVDLINSLNIWGVKIHSLYVMEGTVLADMYKRGEYTPPTLAEYARFTARALARLRPDMIVHRITGDCQPELLLAPEWNRDKDGIIAAVRQEMHRNGWRQGTLFKGE